jgi:eukaryotic-like serine/threonine-protein kinase
MSAPGSLVSALSDRYSLERELGRGGMATVYLARDLKHDREVALKVLRPELAAVLGRERFLAEIRLSAQLDHPHILTLIDSGECSGFLWYVLPFVRGESLRDRLNRDQQLDVDEAVAVTKQIAGALQYAHQRGIIHRDIKPENILFHEGEAMLADFGIALAVKEAGGNRLTETGLSLGTPQYMSPEQATGDRLVDARSDVYSLAAVLYEMLAGEPPVTGTTVQAMIAKLMTERPTRLRVVRDTVPERIDNAVAKALAKVPADRFVSAEEFVRALSRAPEVRETRRAPRMGWLLGVGICVLTLVVVALSRRGSATRQPLVERQLTFSGQAASPAVSPDGKTVAYVSRYKELLLQRLDGGDPVVLVPRVRWLNPPDLRWTGDGSAILFHMMRDSTIDGRNLKLATTWQVPSGGGPATEILADISTFDAGPDGKSAVWARRNPQRLEIVGLAPFRVHTTILVPDSLGEIAEVVWSPDRAWLAIVTEGILVVSANGGGFHRLSASGTTLRWARSGNAIYYLDNSSGTKDLMRVEVNRRSGTARGLPERMGSLPSTDWFDLGPNGVVIHTQVSQSAQALAMTLSGERNGRVLESHILTQGTGTVTSVSITDDGSRVAYSRLAGGRSQIEIVPFGGGPAQSFSSPSAKWGYPSWSPDGSRLAFVRGDSAGARAMVAAYPAEGSVLPLGSLRAGGFTYGFYGLQHPPWWSANGALVAYNSEDTRRLSVVNANTQVETLVQVPDSLGSWYVGGVLSPDGRQMAVSTLRQWQDWGELWLAQLDTGAWRRIQEPLGESSPLRWTSTGWLYLLNHRFYGDENGNGRLEIWRKRMPNGDVEFLATLPSGCGYVGQASISADGRRAVCVLHADRSDLMVATGLIPQEE